MDKDIAAELLMTAAAALLTTLEALRRHFERRRRRGAWGVLALMLRALERQDDR